MELEWLALFQKWYRKDIFFINKANITQNKNDKEENGQTSLLQFGWWMCLDEISHCGPESPTSAVCWI